MNKNKKIIFILLTIITILFTNVYASERKTYINLEGIRGSSYEKGKEDWIEITNFSHQSSIETEDRKIIEVLDFVHEVDKSSADIQKYINSGDTINNVTIEIYRDDTLVQKMILNEVTIPKSEFYYVTEMMEKVTLNAKSYRIIPIEPLGGAMLGGSNVDTVDTVDTDIKDPTSNAIVIITGIVTVILTITVGTIFINKTNKNK